MTENTQSDPRRVSVLRLDTILEDIGQFGIYQKRKLYLILVTTMFAAMHNTQFIFCAAKVDYRCKVPECESKPPKFEPGDWGTFALPKSGSECYRYVPLGESSCTPTNFHTSKTMKCNSWVYKSYNSIVAEFDLGCVEWKRTMIGTFRNVGIFLALGFTAFVSDNYGRRTAYIITIVSAGVMGVIRVFSTSYIMYVVLEFIEAVVGAGLYSAGYVLALEMVGCDYRVKCGNTVTIVFALGQVACALIAWVAPYWKTIILIIYTPAIFFIFYIFVIDESVRWLISKDKMKDAVRIINKAAVVNKKQLSPTSLKLLEKKNPPRIWTSQQLETLDGIKPPSIFKQIISSKTILSRLLICSFWWTTITFTYYGLSINSVSLAGNSYINYILMALVEIPGYYLSFATLDKCGRKRSIITGFFVCAISLLTFALIKNKIAMMLLSMVGKLAISMVFASIYIYTIELFPTTARHTLMNICSMIGRFGSMAAPQAPLLMLYWESLPYVLFGTMATTSGLLMLLTPETYHTSLPDTVLQAEHLQKPEDHVAAKLEVEETEKKS